MWKIHISPCFYTAFDGGNTNTNFGGCLHKGEDMFIPRINKAMKDYVEGVDCPATFFIVLAIQIEILFILMLK